MSEGPLIPPENIAKVYCHLLPPEIIAKVFSHLGDVRDIVRAAQVCKKWSDAASMPHVWKELAVRKYGSVVAEATVGLYEGDWRYMMADDNLKGALPTLTPFSAWEYRFNRPEYYFAGLIVAVKLHRLLEEVHVYIEARGETDLRSPSGSTIQKKSATSESIMGLLTAMGRRGIHGSWRPAADSSSSLSAGAGYYKGCLVFPTGKFMNPGEYTFCYANENHDFGDYFSIPILKVLTEGPCGLEMAFSSPENQKATYTTDVSPFEGDTVESEQTRWETHVPSSEGVRAKLRMRGWSLYRTLRN